MMKKIAIITGATGGFGIEFMKLMVNEPIDEIWAIGRNQQRLDDLQTEFASQKPVKTIQLDLTKRDCYKDLEAILIAEQPSIQYLINNAGMAKFCSYDDLSVEQSLQMIDLNIDAVVSIGLVCLPYMPSGSHLLNIASQASFFPMPYQNIYSATKTFVSNYTRALNVELKDKGIVATAVCPGWMQTKLLDASVAGNKAANNFVGMVTPDVFAAKALADAKRNKDISVYGAYVKMTHLLSRLLPTKLMMKAWLNQQKIK